MKLLVIEDEKNLNDILVKQLKQNKYSVDFCYDAADAIELMLYTEYDLIISDVMMPKMDGFTFLKTIREKGINTTVFFLTAKDDVLDKIKGLDLGATDYIVKPFIFEELLARIRAFTRNKSNVATNILSINDLTLDINTHVLKRGDKVIELSTKEYLLIKYFLLNKEIVLSREQIENNVWDLNYEGGTNLVDVYIRYLRKKIDDDYDIKLIHTIRGSGYVLREGVK